MTIQSIIENIKQKRRDVELEEINYMFEGDQKSKRELERLKGKKQAYDEIKSSLETYVAFKTTREEKRSVLGETYRVLKQWIF